MEDQSLVRSAKTVEEAIELATLELGVGRDEIAVDVISEGRPGLFGIGAEPAKVRVRLLTDNDGDNDSDDSTTSAALNIVYDFLDLLDVDADATIRKEGSELDDQPVIDIQGEDAGAAHRKPWRDAALASVPREHGAQQNRGPLRRGYPRRCTVPRAPHAPVERTR